jgi:hypothetical protein
MVLHQTALFVLWREFLRAARWWRHPNKIVIHQMGAQEPCATSPSSISLTRYSVTAPNSTFTNPKNEQLPDDQKFNPPVFRRVSLRGIAIDICEMRLFGREFE